MTLGSIESLGQLRTPLVLELRHTEEHGAHGGDDEGGAEGEDALPDALGGGELLRAEAVDSADDGNGDENARQQASGGAEPDLCRSALEILVNKMGRTHLLHHLLIEHGVILSCQSALDEGKQDRDDDGGLKGLAEGDEED